MNAGEAATEPAPDTSRAPGAAPQGEVGQARDGGPPPGASPRNHGGPAPPRRGRLPLDPIAEARRHWEEHGWTPAAPGMAAATSIMRAQQILLARVDAVLRPMGLTFARYEVLMLLEFSSAGALPMRVIGQRLQVHPTSVTNAVDRLEADRLVARRPHPADRRAVLVAISPPGRRLARRATDLLNSQVFADLGIAEPVAEQITDGLRQFRRAAGDF